MPNIRNIAIIAHVDHGKTTLVDFLLKQSHTFHAKAEEMGKDLIMDSNDLERERGITILAKNTAVIWEDTKINIIDTPGHADFGGEVERTLNMADGAILLVDAQEGPMPQTKFVLKKALELGLKVIVVINKVDKPGADIKSTIDDLSNLFLTLATRDDQLEFPIIYAIGREGKAWDHEPSQAEKESEGSLAPLFEAVLKFIPAPQVSLEGGFQLLIANVDWDSYQGKYLIGRIARGEAKKGQQVVVLGGAKDIKGRIDKIFVYEGLKRREVDSAVAGDVVALTGVGDAKIGMTIADVSTPEALPAIAVEEPTLRVRMGPNTSPFMGREGSILTSRQIGERLERELETNVSLRVEDLGSGNFMVSGRGELHLSVLIETLRREGFELEVGKPEVIIKERDGVKTEPMEEIIVDVPEEYVGAVTTEFGRRRADLINMIPNANGYTRFIYNISTRNFLGLRGILMTATRGTAVINSTLTGYAPLIEVAGSARNGVLLVSETGNAVSFGLDVAQGRGSLFIGAQTPVYQGMIIGINSRKEDIEINVCKEKHLTNVRSKGNDDAIVLVPPIQMSLEQCLDFIEDDELLEVTPKTLRLRKKYLTRTDRDRALRADK